MSKTTPEQDQVLSLFNENYLNRKTDDIIKLATTDEFASRIKQVLAAPKQDQLKLATEILSPEALRDAGLGLDANSRISSRYFEESGDMAIALGDNNIEPLPVFIPADLVPHPFQPLVQKFPLGSPDIPNLPPSFGQEPVPSPGFPAFPDPLKPEGPIRASIPGSDAMSLCLCLGTGVCLGVGGGD